MKDQNSLYFCLIVLLITQILASWQYKVLMEHHSIFLKLKNTTYPSIKKIAKNKEHILILGYDKEYNTSNEDF